jgi:SAM-dependent methyltransferase
VGVDCCDAFPAGAEADLAGTGLTNVTFLRGDAEAALPEGALDFVFSRFGMMFFADPAAGLRRMRRALRPGGRMAQIVWRAPADDPWLSMANEIVLRHLPAPEGDARSCGPGPFSMSDKAAVRRMMEAAGFDDIAFERVDAPVRVEDDVADAVAFQLAIGPAGDVFREAGELVEAKRPEIEAALAEAVDAQARDAEGIVIDSSSWVIGARTPGRLSGPRARCPAPALSGRPGSVTLTLHPAMRRASATGRTAGAGGDGFAGCRTAGPRRAENGRRRRRSG